MADRDPVLRVVRGTPTPEELAALVLVLARRRGAGAGGPSRGAGGPSAWVRTARPGAVTAGLPIRRGPQAWRASAQPRLRGR